MCPTAENVLQRELWQAHNYSKLRLTDVAEGDTLSHGDEAGWAARTPLTQPPPREVVILSPQGVPVLRANLSLR